MAVNVLELPVALPETENVLVRHDASRGIVWTAMAPKGRLCFHEALLDDMLRCYGAIEQHNRRHLKETGRCPVRYTVLCSTHPDVFSYGGDIARFRSMVDERDREGLLRYALKCIDLVHAGAVNFGLPMTTIALVRGEALGGGFEAGMSASVLVAERKARFALPEILFNLFPGMGAYHLLSRRLKMPQVEEVLTSGNVYTAEEMHKMGVVDVLAEDGEGEKAVHDFVREHARRSNARDAIGRIRQEVFAIPKEALVRTTEMWVETALRLEPSDLKIIDRLVRAQAARVEAERPAALADEA